jgi:hypothetical protein
LPLGGAQELVGLGPSPGGGLPNQRLSRPLSFRLDRQRLFLRLDDLTASLIASSIGLAHSLGGIAVGLAAHVVGLSLRSPHEFRGVGPRLAEDVGGLRLEASPNLLA